MSFKLSNKAISFCSLIKPIKHAAKLRPDKALLKQNVQGPVFTQRQTFPLSPEKLKLAPFLTPPKAVEKYVLKFNKGIPFVPQLNRKLATASGRSPRAILYRNPRGGVLIEDAVAISPADLYEMATLSRRTIASKRRAVRFAWCASFIVFMALLYKKGWDGVVTANWEEAELEVMREEMVETVKLAEAAARAGQPM